MDEIRFLPGSSTKRAYFVHDGSFVVIQVKRMAAIMHHISNYDHDHHHNLYLSLSQEPAKGFLRYFHIQIITAHSSDARFFDLHTRVKFLARNPKNSYI